ncbi:MULTISPECIES: YfiT family bacillithiol transferase [Flavobacterium]|uniref:Metal-dependent hydrolase n=1 Tax=Flavobacterium ginsenosidimutans TaxID=687844 RepID=A0ABZ2Q145_9FLAO|nr:MULTISPECIES: putative metal-dependent hydrolase [Flavobacterium]KAF2330964.1 putative metal-dependent hydrolase [Flavobacterium ginsenosidimutans]MCV2487486.1 putative metal-dependent hydrolase [Flavobacterium sp. SH_e]
MKELDLEKLKYPIGKFIAPENYSTEYLSERIKEIEALPEKLAKETIHLTDEQLDTPYRPDGWTVRQVIHHCAESHMNCYIRIKWALTENNPVIKAYDEVLWSELNDNLTMPIQPTLDLLKGLHFRLGYIMRNLSESDLEKTFIHPSDNSENKLKKIIGSYAWHGNHHLAHITTLKNYKNWK